MTRSTAPGRLTLVVWLLLAGACCASAAGDAEARFEGAGQADPIRITNVKCNPAGTKGEGTVTFDVAWDHSWRAAWAVPAAQHGGQGTLKLENWDAAWVFVKFRKPDADGWSPATLATDAAAHAVPAGATLDVGLTDDGRRGLGVFVYRGADGVPSVATAAVAGEGPAPPPPKAAIPGQ